MRPGCPKYREEYLYLPSFHVTGAAVELAQRNRARLVLYDRDAASAFSDPLPNQWASHREREQYGDPLSDEELVRLGREPLARKVAAARRQDGIAVLLVAPDGSTQLAAGRL
jgi:hypothetical protein